LILPALALIYDIVVGFPVLLSAYCITRLTRRFLPAFFE
jgi:hypothetical protein